MTAVVIGPEFGSRAAVQRRRSWWWVVLTITLIAGVTAIGTWLTAPVPGGRMDPTSTGPDGAHALVTLLRDRGVDVVVASNVADVEHDARPNSLLLIAQTQYVANDDLLNRLAKAPGDLLLLAPTYRARAALTPGIRAQGVTSLVSQPDCVLHEVNRSGAVQLGPGRTYAVASGPPVTSCYGGALIRYRAAGRTVTVVGSTDFMTNGGLLRQGNAALALNLAGTQPRVVWFAPQREEGEASPSATIFDLIPDNVAWIALQLGVVVILVALYQGRRLGPLVAEDLPVVVRASETVEGRGRLYRSRRARDRAALALRTATLQRMLPRFGLGANAPGPAVATAVAQLSGTDQELVRHLLFGPPPATDTDLLHLAHALDDIERQVAHT